MIWGTFISKWDQAVCSKPTLLSRSTKNSRYNLKKSSVSRHHGAADVRRNRRAKITKKEEPQSNYQMDNHLFP